MKDFYQIIILSKSSLPNINQEYLQLNNPIKLINSNELIYNENTISFDYLIFNDISLISNFLETNILHENKTPITNYYKSTSIENIFYSDNIINILSDIESGEI